MIIQEFITILKDRDTGVESASLYSVLMTEVVSCWSDEWSGVKCTSINLRNGESALIDIPYEDFVKIWKDANTKIQSTARE